MPDTELYVGLAGVAVVFAGFAGISVALSGRHPGHWRWVDSVRLSSMIESSIFTAFFSLLPLLVARFTASPEILWRICSIPFLLYAASSLVRAARLTRRAYNSPDYTDRASSVSFVLFFLALIVSVAALLSNALALVVDFMEGFYFLVLLITLGISARMFVRTLSALRSADLDASN